MIKVIIRGFLAGLALTMAAMVPARADLPASCHDNCKIVVYNTEADYKHSSYPTTCHDNCIVKVTDPSLVTCHDKCTIVYLGGAKAENEHAACHDNCKIVAVNSAKNPNKPTLFAQCHDNCKAVAVNQGVHSSGHNNAHAIHVHK